DLQCRVRARRAERGRPSQPRRVGRRRAVGMRVHGGAGVLDARGPARLRVHAGCGPGPADGRAPGLALRPGNSERGSENMPRLVECVPNFSEGRRREVVDQLIAAITAVPGVTFLDSEMDADHTRSVVTFAGEPEPVIEAAVRVTARAAELIDLNTHRGQHPRMGATDVVPFVPIEGVTLDDCAGF